MRNCKQAALVVVVVVVVVFFFFSLASLGLLKPPMSKDKIASS